MPDVVVHQAVRGGDHVTGLVADREAAAVDGDEVVAPARRDRACREVELRHSSTVPDARRVHLPGWQVGDARRGCGYRTCRSRKSCQARGGSWRLREGASHEYRCSTCRARSAGNRCRSPARASCSARRASGPTARGWGTCSRWASHRAPRPESPPAEARPVADGGDVVRIAQVAPLYEAVPPGAYGGTERVIATLCDGLVARGSRGDPVRAGDLGDRGEAGGVRRSRCASGSAAEELVDLAPHLHLQMLAELYRRGDEFDVVHSHLDIWTLPFTAADQHAHGADHARPAGPRLPAGPAAAVRVGAAGLDQRRPAAGGRGPRPRRGRPRSTTGSTSRRTRTCRTTPTATSASSAASPRRRDRWRRSRSRAAPGCRCGWRPRSTRSTRTTTSRR